MKFFNIYAAKEILELWNEYEDNSSLEAKVVKDLDKVRFLVSCTIFENNFVFSFNVCCNFLSFLFFF